MAPPLVHATNVVSVNPLKEFKSENVDKNNIIYQGSIHTRGPVYIKSKDWNCVNKFLKEENYLLDIPMVLLQNKIVEKIAAPNIHSLSVHSAMFNHDLFFVKASIGIQMERNYIKKKKLLNFQPWGQGSFYGGRSVMRLIN